MRRIFLAIGLLLSLIHCRVYAQERQSGREEARQHYVQGKEFYAQGRYQEATSEFEKAIELIDAPRIEFVEQLEEQRKKVFMPAPQPAAAALAQERAKAKKPEAEIKEKEAEISTVKAVVTPEPATESGEREYYVDIGDVLDISVWQIADLSRSEVIVRPDGKISFPLAGDINVEGMTLTQLDNTITEKLKAYVKTPEVSIMIRRFGETANKVVVLGEVPVPGIYKFPSAPTISEVIASAGGYSKYAVLNSIMVMRGDVKAKPEVIRVNFAKIIKSGRLSENIFLKPNDIVYVPRSFVGNVNTFLEILQPAINEYLQTLNARHLHNTVHRKGGI